MKKIVYITLLFSLFTQAQSRYVYDFEPMPVVAMKDSEIEELQRNADIVMDANLFFTDDCLVDSVISCAIGYRKGKEWKVYATPFGTNWRSGTTFKGYSDDRNYAFFEGSIWANGNGHSVESEEFYIVDLVHGSATGFQTDYRLQTWDFPGEEGKEFPSVTYQYVDSKIVVRGNKITIMQSDFSVGETETDEDEDELTKQYGNYDDDSGIYEIQGQKLVKIFYYDEATLRMHPMQFAGSLAKGMVLRDIPELYWPYSDNVELKQVPAFTYGDDTDEMGYELWFEEELQYFLTIPYSTANSKRITGVTVISPEIEVEGLHTGMQVGEILKRYPDAKLNIDLINDWEYLYIKELGLRLMFKTGETNRIAEYRYNNTGDPEAVNIKDKKRKLDYITVE